MKKSSFLLASILILILYLGFTIGKEPAPSDLQIQSPQESLLSIDLFSAVKNTGKGALNKINTGVEGFFLTIFDFITEKTSPDPTIPEEITKPEERIEKPNPPAESDTKPVEVKDKEELVARFVEGLNALSPEKTITIKGEVAYSPNELIRKIEKETLGFYISAVYRTLEVKYETVTLLNKKTLQTKVILASNYHHTPEQESLVNQWVDLKIIEWDLRNLSDYDKVKTIHDNIISNASYIDTVNPNEGEKNTTITTYAGISVHSPYSIIANEKGVCQSYASLFQKFCDRLEIPCRYIVGIGTNDSQISDHAWNKVQIDGNWYNIDLTWDDPVVNFNGIRIDRSTSGFESKKYFLKSDSFFAQDHKAENGQNLPAPNDYK